MEKNWIKVGGKVFKTELTRSRVNIEIDLTKTENNHSLEIEKG